MGRAEWGSSKRSPAGFRPAVSLVAIVAFLALALGPVAALRVPGTVSAGAHSAGFGSTNTTGCNPANLSPAAVRIALPNPSTNVAAGGSVSVTYSVTLSSTTTANASFAVYVPSVVAMFPLASGSNFLLYLAPHQLSLAERPGLDHANVTQSKSVASAVNFRSTGTSSISTQKIAVMANASYGALSIDVRWRWSERPSNGASPVNGSWSAASPNATAPNLPSEFEPAPYVPIVATSPNPARAGSNFTVELGGAVVGQSFRVVLEYPNNGTEITSQWEATDPNASDFNATAPLTYHNGRGLPAAKYLLHIHDRCEAMVHSLTVTVTTSGHRSTGPDPWVGEARETVVRSVPVPSAAIGSGNGL